MTSAEHLAFWLSVEDPPDRFVYVVQAEGDKPIKVGRAVDVRKRIAGLQTGNPRPLRLLHVLPGGAELEWQLHHRLRGFRLVGEWFDGDGIPAFLQFVESLADYLVDGWNEAGHLVNFRLHGDGWAIRRPGQAPTVVKLTDPDPEAVARAASFRKIHEDPPPYKASQRHKEEFAAAHSSHPAFRPYKG
jgi:hypothetical protein